MGGNAVSAQGHPNNPPEAAGSASLEIPIRRKGNAEYGQRAFERALELLRLTIADEKHRSRLKELTRLREALADYFWFDNRYGSCDESWRRYFHAFTYAAAKARGV